jgi:hypothetical protein
MRTESRNVAIRRANITKLHILHIQLFRVLKVVSPSLKHVRASLVVRDIPDFGQQASISKTSRE